MEVLGKHIFVELINENSDLGVVIPPFFKQKDDQFLIGKVKYCSHEAPVKHGDVIIFNKWNGEEVIYNNVRLLMIGPGSIFAVK